MLGVANPAFAVLVRLDPVDIGGNGERRRSLPGSFVLLNHAQACTLYSAEPSGHRKWFSSKQVPFWEQLNPWPVPVVFVT
jgi:hypothetical protein